MKESIHEFKIRQINPSSSSEIELVAKRMRDTLMEVAGAERGEAMYSMEWLIERVLPSVGNRIGKVTISLLTVNFVNRSLWNPVHREPLERVIRPLIVHIGFAKIVFKILRIHLGGRYKK